MEGTQSLRLQLERLKGQKQQLERSIRQNKNALNELIRSLRRHEQAKEIIRTVGQKTQEQLQFHISDIVSIALTAVFKDPYTLSVNFVQRRNKVECDLLYTVDGHMLDPLTGSGLGVSDVSTFALRMGSWSMERPHTRNVILLDEPFRFLSANNQERASAMLKEISDRMGIQFIIITHEKVLASYADRIWEVEKNVKTKVSTVTQM